MEAPDRWQELKKILHSALKLEAAERQRFLDERCDGDLEIRREIESLIAAHDKAGNRFEEPALEIMAAATFVSGDDGMSGRLLSHYRIAEKIGSGGMGDVYLADDGQLGRKVALKLLPAVFTQDPERVRRFQQEARAASALNHPNILTIHEIGYQDSVHYIATEFVQGETLRELIGRGPLKLGIALDIAVQATRALVAAHDAGIVHRDIKPENIMYRDDGIVKVLDFGLAKLTERPDAEAEAATMVNTAEGVVIGTAQYMSPEQARGLVVDPRTDIWSLGCVIYEMVAGRAPFDAPNPGDVIVSVLERDPPPLTRSVAGCPPELDWIVKKALRKEREERYQTTKELLSDLRNFRQQLQFEAGVERSSPPEREALRRPDKQSDLHGVTETTEQTIAHPTSSAEYIVTSIKQHKRAAVLIPVILVATVAGILYLLQVNRPSNVALRNSKFLQLTDRPGPEYFPSVSPDGKEFVYAGLDSGNFDIYLRKVGGKNPINLTQDSPEIDTQPVFSPDGQQIAFRSERDGGGIFVMGATGENVKRLTDFCFNPSWSPDGKHLACADEFILNPSGRNNLNSRIWVIDVVSGERKQITNLDSVTPNWSPNGSRIAYQGRRNEAHRDIWTIPAAGGEPVEVTNDAAVDWNPVWSPDGDHLYFISDRGGSMNLWRVPIEEQTGKVLGPFEAVTTPSPHISHLSFSRDGRVMLYAHVVNTGNIKRMGFDPVKETVEGEAVWITQGSRRALLPSLAPDGEWLAFDTQGDREDGIFIVNRDGTGLRELIDDDHKDRRPRWSPDGKRIAFFSDRSGKWEVWVINADGSGLRQITHAEGPAINPTWSPDGTRLVYRNSGRASAIIDVERAWHDQTPQTLPPMTDPPGRMFVWSWSPDGRKLAGLRERTDGRPRGIIVFSLDSQSYETLTDFGSGPVWLGDNQRLLFLDGTKLSLIDSRSKKVRELVNLSPQRAGGITLAPGDRTIYFSLMTEEADVWMMTLE